MIANTAWRNPADFAGGPWHCDAGPHIPRPEDVPWDDRIPYPVFAIGAHIYLQDCTRADGPTAIVPGSHRSGRLAPFDQMFDAGPHLRRSAAGDHRGRRPATSALFVSDVWHRGLPADRRRAGPLLPAGALRPPRHRAAARARPNRSNQLSPEAIERAKTERAAHARRPARPVLLRRLTRHAWPPTTKNASRCSSTTRTSPSARAKRWAARPLDFRPIADALAERGRVVVRRAYADWSRFGEDRRELTRHHVELIEIPQRMGAVRKNAADIKMAVDAIELSFERDYITTFVLGTGDSDFTPLVHKLRELNRRVIGIGIEASTSALLPPACDEFLFYERLEGVEPVAPTRSDAAAPARSRTPASPSRAELEPTSVADEPRARRSRSRRARHADAVGARTQHRRSGARVDVEAHDPAQGPDVQRDDVRLPRIRRVAAAPRRARCRRARRGHRTRATRRVVPAPRPTSATLPSRCCARSSTSSPAQVGPAAPVGPEEPAAQGCSPTSARNASATAASCSSPRPRRSAASIELECDDERRRLRRAPRIAARVTRFSARQEAVERPSDRSTCNPCSDSRRSRIVHCSIAPSARASSS